MSIKPANKISFRALTRGLGRTIFLSLLGFSLIPLCIAGWLNYQKSSDSLYEKETKALEAALQQRAVNLNTFFQERVNDLSLLANDENNINLLTELEAGFKKSERPLADFIKSYDYVRLSSQLDSDPRAFLEVSGDYDLLLIDTRGNILYSVAAESDLGTNLVAGALKDSELAKAFHAALETGQPVFSDMARYQPSGNQVSIFGANMVVDENGEKLGVLVLQLNIFALNDMLADTTGLGDTGQIFLLGRDGTLRSKPRNDPTKKILFARSDNPLNSTWVTDEEIRHRGDQPAHSAEEVRTYQIGSYGGPRNDQILTVATNLHQLEKFGIHWLAVAEIESNEVYGVATDALRTTLIFLFVTASLVVLLATVLTRRMIDPIAHLTAWAGEVSRGDLRVQEIRTPENEIGILNEAMKNMVGSLQKLNNERDERDWFKTGIAQVSALLQGDQDLTLMGRSVLSNLATYLDLQVGALFIADDDSLHLLAGYAYKFRQNNQSSFKWGEGVVGQAALEQKTIYLNAVPDEHLDLEIDSGLAVSTPRTILIVPLLHEGKVQGVIEFGSFHAISGQDITLIETAASSIAVAIHSAQAREKLALLLEQSQSQAEELATQQEELRQTNEELEEQTQLLEEQKRALNAQNIELDRARKAVEQKAAEVALASRYKSEFLANMSHELRTPLNSILLLSKHLSNDKDKNLTEKQVECATTIHSSGSELLSLINEVLDLAKVESGKLVLQPEDCYIKDLTAAMERTFGPLANSKGLELLIQIAATMPEKLHTDCQRLAQIIKNLLSNACKFTQKGSVTLELGMDEGALPVTIKVKDTGIGIAQNKIDAVFQAFQQEDGSTMRKYGGTGLGLSISRELAVLLGGKLEAESVVGQGSIFTLRLPEKLGGKKGETPGEAVLIPATDKSEVTNDARPDAFAGAVDREYIADDRKELSEDSRTILIIDDDPVFARILRDAAREKGFMTLVAESGETGLHLTSLYRPDGIILDMGLPGMDGKTVLFRLKDNLETRHIPVHIISASDKDLEPMHMGAVGYLTKPVTMEIVNDAFSRIEKVLEKGMKKVLLVEDDQAMQQAVSELIDSSIVKTTTATTGAEAKRLLENEDFDCMVLDLSLPDMSGHELLKYLKQDNDLQLPVIIHTARELTADERQVLDSLAGSIIVKDVKSMDRLLDESSLFLHQVATELPEAKKEMIRKLHDREAILENKKVLIVDDDMRNVFSLVSILEEKGIDTIVAENGKVALAKLEENPDTDLVLMDIMMPEMDGYEAMEKIRALESNLNKVPIIALTAKAMKGDRAKCIKSGASDYLSKPVDEDKLFSMLRVWLY